MEPNNDINTVTIHIEFFMNLCAYEERINAVERLVKSQTYVNANDILAVLGIAAEK